MITKIIGNNPREINKIMIIEDEFVLLALLKAQIKNNICKTVEIVSVGSVEKALYEYIMDREIGLVIIDYNLGKDCKDGSCFIKAVKMISDRDVLVANSVEISNNQKMIEAGADFMMNKDFNVLKSWIESKKKVFVIGR